MLKIKDDVDLKELESSKKHYTEIDKLKRKFEK